MFRRFVLTFAIPIIFVLPGRPVQASNLENHRNIEAGVGFASPYGLIGASARYFLNGSVDLHSALGIDPTGLLAGIGARYYLPGMETKCFFIIDCSHFISLSSTVSAVNGSSSTVVNERLRYRHSSGTAAHFGVGSFTIYGGKISSNLEVGRRVWIDRPEFTLIEGKENREDKNVVDQVRKDSLYVSMTFGYLF